ncbi:MAG: manganese efflux pump [Bacteroidales bacterium]|nr:manganese efflux pump [Bacteroidales bacterium]
MVELLLLSLALAMDCFTVSVVCGVIVRRYKAGLMLRLAFLFGFFQALMPFIGWLLTNSFSTYLEAVDHWIAFGLLFIIGVEMISDAFKKEENKTIDPYGFKSELLLAVATSIDALAIGISFACTGYNEVAQLGTPLLLIGVASFLMSLIGFALGVRFGDVVTRKVKPEILGGIILIGIGIKILIEHLG